MALNDRDKKILRLLARFRVLSRTQIETLICPEVARPSITANRIMKRLARDGLVTQIVRPRDEPYLYMPSPPVILTESSKTRHFLGLVDIYIALGQPEIFQIEPKVNDKYQPDVYARVPQPVIIEYQRSRVSTRVIQSKVDEFHRALLRGEHDARVLWIASDATAAAPQYEVKVPEGIDVTSKEFDQNTIKTRENNTNKI